MARALRGQRYIDNAPAKDKANVTWLAEVLANELPFLDYKETRLWYHHFTPTLSEAAQALLGCNDRYWLLTILLNREDLLHPWLFDRCREVEAEPDGHIDLWARGHYKSTIITTGGAIQEILCDPETTIAIFSVVKPTAVEFLAQIKNEFEANERLKQIYADVLYENPRSRAGEHPSKWSLARGITVKRKGNPKEATVEAHGLIDGQPTGRHFKRHIYDDVVTQDYLTDDQLKKTTARFEMADNLGSRNGAIKWIVGTRYCTIGTMRILMGDWSHKPISDVEIGDTVVGWELKGRTRWLRPSKVVHRGVHRDQPVKTLVFSNGRSVTCTGDHRWWRGPHGGGPEYAPLALPLRDGGKKPPNGKIIQARQLLVPLERNDSRDAAWLAGFFDGEGTVWKNTHHPSGVICITQTTHNSLLIEETRAVLGRLNFEFRESWVAAAGRKRMTSDRCVFSINGGWSQRYRFLTEISPVRRERIAATLFGQLFTDKTKVTRIDDAGTADVHWLETETGNYVIEGFCSSNSFADTYGVIIDRGSVKPRIYPATEDGTLATYRAVKNPKGGPDKVVSNLVLLEPAHWDRIKRDQGLKTTNAQMLLNPIAGSEATFRSTWLRSYEIIPRILNVYILVDPSKGTGERSDRTAIPVIGIDQTGNKYLLDGVCHRMKLTERLMWVEQFKRYWENAPGVQIVKVGWERYGMSVELEVVEEILRSRDNFFPIQELNTPRQGGHSKDDRIERLEPDIRNGRFYLPCTVHHLDFGARGGEFAGQAYWSVWDDEDQKAAERLGQKPGHHIGQIIYRPVRGFTKTQRDYAGQKYRIVAPLKRKDENKDIYDLTRVFIEELIRHPFAAHDDIIDAASRIYDIEPLPPMAVDAKATESIDVDDSGIDFTNSTDDFGD